MKAILFFLGLICLDAIPAIAQLEVKSMSPQIDRYVILSENCINTNHSDSCIQYYYEAIKVCKELKQDQHLDYLYFNLGRNYFQYTNHLDSASAYLQMALRLSLQQKDDSTIADVSNTIGSMYLVKGKMDSAMHYFLRTSESLEKIKDTVLLAFVNMNIGSLYSNARSFEKANIHLIHAYDLLDRKGFIQHKASIAAYVGSSYLSLNKTDSANTWARRALKIVDSSHDAVGYIVASYVLGDCFLKNNETDSSLYHLNNAIEKARKINFHEIQSEALLAYSSLMLKLNRNKEALSHAEEALVFLKQYPNNNISAQAYKNAAKAAAALKLYDQSISYYEQYIVLQDSITSQSHISAMNELNIKYETEKKERLLTQQQLTIQQKDATMRNWLIGGCALMLLLAAALLQYRRTQRLRLLQAKQEQENAVLRAWVNGEERERNRISKDLHDGVAAMISAAKMGLQAIPFLKEEKKAEQLLKTASILDSTHTEVRRIAHNLLPVTLQKEGLVTAIRQFIFDINQTGILNVTLNAQLQSDLKINSQTELMLFRIVQELINNIIKHSQATLATVSLSLSQQQLSISIDDNGKGFSESRESQGLYSIRERLEALGGNFDIGNKDAQGTRASLVLNLDKLT